jgi:hypothetical protein
LLLRCQLCECDQLQCLAVHITLASHLQVNTNVCDKTNLEHLLAAVCCAGIVCVSAGNTSCADVQHGHTDTLTMGDLLNSTALAIKADHSRPVACERVFFLLRNLPQLERLRIAGFQVSRRGAHALAGSIKHLLQLQVGHPIAVRAALP